MLTLVLDHLTFSVTGGTDTLLLHHAEDALCGVGDDTATMAGGTLLLAAAGFCARTAAMRADDILAHLEFLGDALVDLLQRQFHFQTQVAATMLLRTTGTASEATKSVTSEDVAEHRENVVHIHRGTTEAAEIETSGTRTCEAKLVVLLTRLRVVQHVIGLCGLLEFLLSLLVARITVGVVLDGYLSIGFLYLVFRGGLIDPKHLIIISFLCHLIVHYPLSIVHCHWPTATFACRMTLSFSL